MIAVCPLNLYIFVIFFPRPNLTRIITHYPRIFHEEFRHALTMEHWLSQTIGQPSSVRLWPSLKELCHLQPLLSIMLLARRLQMNIPV